MRADAVGIVERLDSSRCSPGDFPLFLARDAAYTCSMEGRRTLVAVSMLATTATLIAVVKGAWLYGLVLYGVSVVVLGLLLRRAVRKRRAQAHPPSQSAAHS